jgi:hypothetical protein
MLQDRASALVAGQYTRKFSIESGAASETAYIVEEANTFEIMTDTYGDGIC